MCSLSPASSYSPLLRHPIIDHIAGIATPSSHSRHHIVVITPLSSHCLSSHRRHHIAVIVLSSSHHSHPITSVTSQPSRRCYYTAIITSSSSHRSHHITAIASQPSHHIHQITAITSQPYISGCSFYSASITHTHTHTDTSNCVLEIYLMTTRAYTHP